MKEKEEKEEKEEQRERKKEGKKAKAKRTKQIENDGQHRELYDALVDKKTIMEFYGAWASFENCAGLPEVSRKVSILIFIFAFRTNY